MAFTAAVEWDVRTTGDDANGGGFAVGSGGTDFSQQDAAEHEYDDLVIDASTATDITSVARPFTSIDVGNIINVTGGTGFTVQRVQILSVAAGVATCDKNVGTTSSTGGTGNLGGSMLSPAVPCGLTVGGNTVWIKSGTYAIIVNTNNVAGGKLSPVGTVTGATGPTCIIGYETTHGDMGTPPLLQASGIDTFNIVNLGAGEWAVNLSVDGASAASCRGINCSNTGLIYKCKAVNCTLQGLNGPCVYCEATACDTPEGLAAIIIAGGGYGCVAHGNAGAGIMATTGVASHCISINNTGASGDGFVSVAGAYAEFHECIAYGNSRDGFRLYAADETCRLINCVAAGNTGYQFGANAAMGVYLMLNCAAKADGSGAFDPNLTNPALFPKQINCITLTADPFVNAAGGNFALNDTPGGGLSCRAAGLLGVFPGAPTINTTGFQDIGAAQHEDTPGMSGGVLSLISLKGSRT